MGKRMGLLSLTWDYDCPCPKCGFKLIDEYEQLELPFKRKTIHIDLDVRNPEKLDFIRRNNEKTV
jgi:hypothetical protein